MPVRDAVFGALAGVRRLAKRAVRAVGYDFVQSDGHTTLEAHLGTLFRRLDVNCVLDVGAHEGEFGTMLRRGVGFRGDIVSVEPVKARFEVLSRRIAPDRRWRAHRFALGNATGRLPIRVVASTVLSSFLAPNAYAAERFGEGAVVTHLEEVEVRRLEDAYEDLVVGLDAPRPYLKVDTQGYDMRVVEGAGAALANFAGLQVELPVKPLYDGMTPIPAALERLEGLGFDLTGMYPVARDADGLRIVEYDCVFVRRARTMVARLE